MHDFVSAVTIGFHLEVCISNAVKYSAEREEWMQVAALERAHKDYENDEAKRCCHHERRSLIRD